MDEFWLLSKNKVSFQQFFIKQLLTEDTGGYNCSQLLQFGQDELWFISGKNNSEKFFLVHEVLDKTEPDVLPTLHTLTGGDSIKKVSTRAAALRTAIEGNGEYAFGRSEPQILNKMPFNE